MKLKVFDLGDIFYQIEDINYEEVKEKIKPYVLYFRKDDTIGICNIDNKKTIVKILKEYGDINLKCNFTNPTTFFKTDDIDWDYIYLGDIELDGNDVWKEFGILIEKEENELFNSENVEDTWYKYQRIALKNILDKEIERKQTELEYMITAANYEYEKHKGINELR